ncbi:MAG: trypsin-like serine protease [Bacteriovoracaceae bacterium]
MLKQAKISKIVKGIYCFILLTEFVLANDLVLSEYNKSTPLLELDQNLIETSIGGRIVNKSEEAWRQSVFLFTISKNDYINKCSGTIIAKDTILTSAHCIKSNVDHIDIFFGMNGKTEESVKKRSSKFTLYKTNHYQNWLQIPQKSESNQRPYLDFNHDYQKKFQTYFDSLTRLQILKNYDLNFSSEDNTDLALVFFEGGLPRGFKVANIHQGPMPKFKEYLWSYGYGIDTRELNERQYMLREAREMVFTYYVDKYLYGIFILAYSGGHSLSNTCIGDSGGGSFVKNRETKNLELVAINTNTTNSCAGHSGHLIIHPFLNWIEEKIKEYRSSKSI